MNAQMGRYFPKHGHIWQFIEQLKFHEHSKAQDMLKMSKLDVGALEQVRRTKSAKDRDAKIKILSERLKKKEISAVEFLEIMADNRLLHKKGTSLSVRHIFTHII